MPNISNVFESNSLDQTAKVGASIASMLSFPSCVYLEGDLGAGKTTLTKSIIQSLGYVGEVTSPTYNLIQEYQVEQGMVYHMDLYRLQDPSELEFLGLEDLWSQESLFLVEWPKNGDGFLQVPNVEVTIIKQVELGSQNRSISVDLI